MFATLTVLSARLGRRGGQALVETSLAFVVLTLLLGMAMTVAWWGYAQVVVTAAVQDAARAASAFDGDLPRNLTMARRLVQVGLGTGAAQVYVRASEDAESVTFTARGHWPVVAGMGFAVDLPLAAEAHILKDKWRP